MFHLLAAYRLPEHLCRANFDAYGYRHRLISSSYLSSASLQRQSNDSLYKPQLSHESETY